MPGLMPRSMKQSEIVARHITARIVEEGLEEGTRLPNEREMLEEYDVGRSTLREALRLLENRGVLTIRTGRDGGPVVRWPRASDLGESLTLLLEFERVPFSEVFAARQALEPRLARMAARNIDRKTLAAIRRSIDNMAENLEDRAIFREENFRFHELVASAAKSKILEIFSAALESVADGMAFGAVEAAFATSQRALTLAAHERLYDALSVHDEDKAERAMEDHLVEGRKFWSEAYRHLAKSPVRWASVPPVATR